MVAVRALALLTDQVVCLMPLLTLSFLTERERKGGYLWPRVFIYFPLNPAEFPAPFQAEQGFPGPLFAGRWAAFN